MNWLYSILARTFRKCSAQTILCHHQPNQRVCFQKSASTKCSRWQRTQTADDLYHASIQGTLPHTRYQCLLQQILNNKGEAAPKLDAVSNIALTTDIWKSRATQSYLRVTDHFITADWKLESNVLFSDPGNAYRCAHWGQVG